MIMHKVQFCVCIIALFSISFQHYIHKVEGPQVQISTYTNVANAIQIPFKKCFKAEPQLAANNRYITFESSSLQLTQITKGYISQQKNISILQNLRSPQTFMHENLLVFNDYSLAFISPNIIQVIKQVPANQATKVSLDFNKTIFKVVDRYPIKQINQFSRFKMYQFNNKAFFVVYETSYVKSQISNSKKVFILNDKGYRSLEVPNNHFISHFEAVDTENQQFFTSEFNEGIGCYSYNQKQNKINVLANYIPSMFDAQMIFFVDINVFNLKEHKIIYALDTIKGVYMLNLTQSQKNPKIDLVLAQPNCNALDSMRVDHVVLVCQLGSNSYIVQAYGKYNEVGKMIFERLQPQYHINFFNDLEINSNYFMVFSHKILNVYWNAKQNNIPEAVDTQSQLSLPGLQTFYFKMNKNIKENKSYLYTIQSSIMIKYEIKQSDARLAVRSQNPTQKKFKVSMFGNCQDLQGSKFQKKLTMKIKELRGITCQLTRNIILKAVEQNSPRKQDFSVSASIIVILIVVFLLVIWICLKKYKGLQKQARKILDTYKRKKPRQQLSL